MRDTVELEVAGRRIAGVGGGRIGEAAVVVGNLLLDFDYQTMAQVWRAARGGKAATEREAGCMLAHLDALKLHTTLLLEKLAAGGVLDKEHYPQIWDEVNVLRLMIDLRLNDNQQTT